MRLIDELAKANAAPMLFSVASETDMAAHAAATSPINARTEPTPEQKDAGNYKKGHIVIAGLHIAIENPEGSTRKSQPGVEPAWERTIQDAHYGYIKGTVGADKDHVDVFVKPSTPADFGGTVYIVDQIDENGKFDEHKVLLGYASKDEAVAAYKANYPADFKVGAVRELALSEFKKQVAMGGIIARLYGATRAQYQAYVPPMLSKQILLLLILLAFSGVVGDATGDDVALITLPMSELFAMKIRNELLFDDNVVLLQEVRNLKYDLARRLTMCEKFPTA